MPVEMVSLLRIDPGEATMQIVGALRHHLAETLHRRGLVVAMSGGVDSSVCAALAVRAVGPRRVYGIFMPERDSDPESQELARTMAEQLGIEFLIENITPILEVAGSYRWRDAAIRRLVPEYGADWRFKVVLPGNRLDSDRLNMHYLALQPPGGDLFTVRLPPTEYREIVAATNFKQRVRKMLEYFHADRLHYAVVGTANRLEYDQGFFVKGGDGLADIKPIAHLYKTQVYQLADHLGVPRAITSRAPTTDTYSLPQTQEEFYFAYPVQVMDQVLHAYNAGMGVGEAAEALGYTPNQIERVYREIEQKRSTTRYLHLTAQLVGPVPQLTLASEIER